MFLMPTLLADTNLFLWVDIEAATPEEARHVLTVLLPLSHPLGGGLPWESLPEGGKP